jgi:ABC-type amino acid transport substrate-binding protein
MGLCPHRRAGTELNTRSATASVLAWSARFVLAIPFAPLPAAALPQPAENKPLAICMQQNDPPLSLRAGPSGFDLALARTIAQRLGRDLHVQWFVSRDDPDADLVRDANALLSDGRCQLVAEYPLTEATLAPPRAPSAKLPPFDGAKPDDRRRWVAIGPLAVTRPYRLDALAIVLPSHDPGRQIRTLADLDGLKTGVQLATLADAIAMRYDGGRLQNQIVHVADSRDLFDKLQNNELDAAFVDLRAFDAWRLKHASANLADSGYRHSLGFNTGFVGLAANQALIDQVDTVLSELQAQDAIRPLAAGAGLTFMPPRTPGILTKIQPAALNGD